MVKDNLIALQSLNEQNRERFLNLYKNPLKDTPIVEFSFQRFFIGGEHISLFSHKEFSHYYFSYRNDLGCTFSESIKNLKPNQLKFFLWPQTTADPVFERIYNFGIYCGMTIYLRIGNYVNAYHFSGDPKYDVVNYYLNNMTFLINFTLSFEKKICSFFDFDDHEVRGQHRGPFILDSFNDQKNNKSSNIFLIGDKEIHFTQQEMKCYDLLATGYSAKGIAKQLKISPRTAETYIYNIRMKNNNISKDQLIEYYHLYIKPNRFSY